jgi:hypothetical protein
LCTEDCATGAAGESQEERGENGHKIGCPSPFVQRAPPRTGLSHTFASARTARQNRKPMRDRRLAIIRFDELRPPPPPPGQAIPHTPVRRVGCPFTDGSSSHSLMARIVQRRRRARISCNVELFWRHAYAGSNRSAISLTIFSMQPMARLPGCHCPHASVIAILPQRGGKNVSDECRVYQQWCYLGDGI